VLAESVLWNPVEDSKQVDKAPIDQGDEWSQSAKVLPETSHFQMDSIEADKLVPPPSEVSVPDSVLVLFL
jgi:hypothetical protein